MAATTAVFTPDARPSPVESVACHGRRSVDRSRCERLTAAARVPATASGPGGYDAPGVEVSDDAAPPVPAGSVVDAASSDADSALVGSATSSPRTHSLSRR